MSTLLQRAIEARANDWSTLNELRAAINEAGGAATGEQTAEWDRIERSILDHTGTIEREQRAVDLDAKFAAISEDPHLAGGQSRADRSDADDQAKAYRSVFVKYLRGGMDEMDVAERRLLRSGFDSSKESRALSEGTNTAGGFLVPQDYWARITEVMKAYGGLQAISNQITTSDGRQLPWPKNDDTANSGAWLGENTQVSAVDLAFTQSNILTAWTATSNLVLASLELLQDSAFDLDSWIPKKLGQRIGRVAATAYMNGSGTSQPTGLLPALSLHVTSTHTGVAGQAQYDDLVSLTRAIDPAYRQNGNCRFVMSDAALGDVLKLVSTQGVPLWQPTLSASAPDQLLGYPYTIDQAVPTPAVNAKSILFGDFEAAYVVRTVQGGTMMRLTERYADFLQVGFFGFVRTDGKPDDTNAVAYFQGAAT